MKNSLIRVVGLSALCASVLVHAGLEEEMTAQEREAAGLGKLSASELAFLNQWLEDRQIATPQPVNARILGDFDGWEGETRFRLDNGQIWQQRVGGRYKAALRTNPEVRIEHSRFGYYLRVVETGRMVGVQRIR